MTHLGRTTLTLFAFALLWACSSSTDDPTSTDDAGANDVQGSDGSVSQDTDDDGTSSDAGSDTEEDQGVTPEPTVGETTQTECVEVEVSVDDTTQAECIEPTPGDITVGPTTQSECTDDEDTITETEQNECMDVVTIGPVTIEPCEAVGTDLDDELLFEPGPGRFTFTHVNATYNCCGLVEMTVDVVGDVIVITEHQVYSEEHPDGCRCNCEFTLSAEVTGLVAGSHAVRVVNDETGHPYGEDVTVTVTGDESIFGAKGGAGRIDLTHINALHNCCVDVAMAYTLEGNTITIRESETGDLCDCNCTFDLSASILELPAGTYTVQGAPVGDPIDVVVTAPEDIIDVEVFQDTLVIHHNNADWNCCGIVEMEVTVEGDLILVEEVETNPDGLCRCTCLFDFSVEASGFEAGSYTVRVFTHVGDEPEIFGEVEVDIPGLPTDDTSEQSIALETTEDYSIEVTHAGATYNCCSIVVMTATVDDTNITVEEVITNDELCHCICDFEISTSISNLVPNTYTVTVNSADGTAVGSDTVTVTGDGVPVPEEEVVFERSGSAISVHHTGALFNCCAEVDMTLVAQGSTLDITETVGNPDEICDCECFFNLTAEIVNLEADTDYTVRLWQNIDEGDPQLIHEEVVAAE